MKHTRKLADGSEETVDGTADEILEFERKRGLVQKELQEQTPAPPPKKEVLLGRGLNLDQLRSIPQEELDRIVKSDEFQQQMKKVMDEIQKMQAPVYYPWHPFGVGAKPWPIDWPSPTINQYWCPICGCYNCFQTHITFGATQTLTGTTQTLTGTTLMYDPTKVYAIGWLNGTTACKLDPD